MPINIVYEDPVLLGQATRDAYGLARRRNNLDQSIERQLQADRANSELALNYEQLYGGMAQRELDRHAQMSDSVADRQARAEMQQRGWDQATQQAEAEHENQLALVDARTTAERGQLEEAQKREVSRIDGAIGALDRGVKDGSWKIEDPIYQRERHRLEMEKHGIQNAPRPGLPSPPGLKEEMGSNVWQLPDGRGMFYRDPSTGQTKYQPFDQKPLIPLSEINAATAAAQRLYTTVTKDPRTGIETRTVDQTQVDAYINQVVERWRAVNGLNAPPPQAPSPAPPPGAAAPPVDSLTFEQAQAEYLQMEQQYGKDGSTWPKEKAARAGALVKGQQRRQARETIQQLQAAHPDPANVPPEVRKQVLELLKLLAEQQ